MKFFKQCQELISTNFPQIFLLSSFCAFEETFFWEWEFRLMQQKHACFLLVKLIDIDLWEFIWERIRSWICYPLYRDFRFMVGQSITYFTKAQFNNKRTQSNFVHLNLASPLSSMKNFYTVQWKIFTLFTRLSYF